MYFKIISYGQSSRFSNLQEDNIDQIETIENFLISTLFPSKLKVDEIALCIYLDSINDLATQSITYSIQENKSWSSSPSFKYRFNISGSMTIDDGSDDGKTIFKDYRGSVTINQVLTITNYSLGEDHDSSRCNHQFIEIPFQQIQPPRPVPCSGTGDYHPDTGFTTCYNPLDNPINVRIHELGLDHVESETVQNGTTSGGICGGHSDEDWSVTKYDPNIPHTLTEPCPFVRTAVTVAQS